MLTVENNTARSLRGSWEEYPRHPLDPGKPGWLDYRTFEVFKYREAFILYDIATGAVLATDERAYDLLSRAKDHTKEELLRLFPGEEYTLAFEEIEILREAGFFQYEGAPSEPEAEQYFESLWNHAPRRIQLFVAQSCNLACKYCYAEEQGSNARGKLMTFDVAKQAVDYLVEKSRNRPHLSIQFFGGEALLNFRLIKQVVEYCKGLEKTTDKKFFYQISTNGVLLTPEARKFLVEHQFASLVSIDGDKEGHDRNRVMRGGAGSYDRVVDNALKFQQDYLDNGQHHEQLKIRATLTRNNASAIKAADAIAAAGFLHIGVGSAEERPFSTSDDKIGFTAEQRMALDIEQEEFLDRFLEAVRKREKPVYSPYEGALAQMHNTSRYYYGIMCGVGRNTNAVDTDGVIFPCHRYVGMDNYKIGDIYNGLDKEAIMNYYRQAHYTAKPKCSGCWARRLCGGLCTWLLSNDDGEVWRASETMCDGIRKGIHRSLYAYYASKKIVTENQAEKNKQDLQSNPEETGNTDPEKYLGIGAGLEYERGIDADGTASAI